MKNLKLYVSACLLACSTMASAQFTTGNAGGGATTSAADTEGWSKIYVSYDPMTAEYDVDGADDLDFTGISFGFAKGFSISQSMPLFVEAGLGLTYGWWSEDDGESDSEDGYSYSYSFEEKIKMFSLKVPVNLAYKFAIPNSNISVTPYAGISMRLNLSAKGEWEESESYTYRGETESESDSGDYDLFDEDDMGEDNTWNRFQIGWQIGANVDFNNFTVGVQYGSDFNEISEKCKLSTTSISVGFKF